MRLKKRLLALALAVLLVLPGVLLSPALSAAAQTTSDLYGTGSADEIKIVKLLDMALNKGGMSMSPATIRAFLEYWWSSVKSDLNTCIGNAGSAITTTQDFAEYIYTALENTDHYDKLGSIVKKYVQYVLTMEVKSLSDFKQLLLQSDTFRKFLLSYVTDEDGNIVGTVDNKLKKYNIGKTFVNMTRQAAEAYIEEYEGYFLVPTTKVSDILPTWFTKKTQYDDFCDMVNHHLDIGFYGLFYNGSFSVLDFNDTFFVSSSSILASDKQIYLFVYNSNWEYEYSYKQDNNLFYYDSSDNLQVLYRTGRSSNNVYLLPEHENLGYSSYGSFYFRIYSRDGSSFKVWKSVDQYKLYSVGKSNIYYTNSYSNFDASVDNSIEFSGSYYNNNSSTYSHDVIQNNIDNSSEVNESAINNITNQTINNITNNYGDSSGSGSGSGSGTSGSGGWWNVGEGLSAFIQGVAELLDFLLKLLGDLIGLLATFATSVLDLLKSLAVVGTEFGDFLTEVFGFLPPECINLIMASIGGMCIVGVIKIFKK